jgi:hypothetical protein
MIPRRLAELALFAIAVPVVFFGVQRWRGLDDPHVSVSAPLSVPGRPQLGRAMRRPADGNEDAIEDSRRVRTPVGSDVANGSWFRVDAGGLIPPRAVSTPGRVRAVLIHPRATDPSADRKRGAGLAGTLGATTPATFSAAAAGTVTGGASPLAIVEFVGLMQDETLLKRDDFPAELVRQLKITVWWNATGRHSQRLELFTPDGVFYRRFASDFTATGGANRTPVDTLLAVGGSWITEYSLFGAWRADVYLDGQPQPTTTAAFVLNP